jgi:hypothetical protein
VPLLQNTQTLVAAMIALSTVGLTAHAAQSTVQLGPRPFYLVDQMEAGDLKDKLAACVALGEGRHRALLHHRSHLSGNQASQGQDGRVQPQCLDRGGIPWGYAEVPD